MACEFGREVEIKFEKSGLTVYPSEFDLRNENGSYAHLRAKFGENTGQRISNFYLEAEPVILYFDGVPVNRFYIPPEAFTFRRQLDRPTEATAEFNDAIQVLSRGTIEKDYVTVSLGEVIDYIFDNRDDPNDVLSGYRFVNEEDAERTKQGIADAFEFTNAIDEDITTEATEYVYDLLTGPDADSLFTGFEFEGISPLQALGRVLSAFEIDYKVETDGTVVFGKFGTDSETYVVGYDTSDFTLSRYDVTTSANRTNRVLVRGSYEMVRTKNESGNPESTKLRPYGSAKADGLSGDSLELEAKNVKSLAELQQIAVRALAQELMKDVNGSLVIDSMATESEENLANLGIGDHIVVGPSIPEKCDSDVSAGAFLVQTIHHKASRTLGWTADVEVSQVAFPNSISTQTFYYDPRTGQRVEEVDAFNEYYDGAVEGSSFRPT